MMAPSGRTACTAHTRRPERVARRLTDAQVLEAVRWKDADPARDRVLEAAAYLGLDPDQAAHCLDEAEQESERAFAEADLSNADTVHELYLRTEATALMWLGWKPAPDGGLPHNLRRAELATSLLQAAGARDVTDYGAGAGDACILLARLGYAVRSVDLPGPCARLAAWRYRARGLDLPCLVPEDLEAAPASLDAVTCFDVLEHLSDPMATLARIRNALRPGGLLLLYADLHNHGTALHLRPNAELEPVLDESLAGLGLNPLCRLPMPLLRVSGSLEAGDLGLHTGGLHVGVYRKDVRR